MEKLEIKKAVRRALPLQLSIYGPTGSGKTLSAILLAAGLSPDGRVVVIDTEAGRASLYADNKRVLEVLPNGFDVVELDAPYSPQRYSEAIDLCESSGYKVCIIDSGSDSWDGPGGCSDIAERANGNWAGAKLQNKRMMRRAADSDMHIIWLLKAHEKTKVIDKKKSASGKMEYLDMGIQPIWEKNNFYPMFIGFSVDEKTHMATAVKAQDGVAELFSKPRLLSKADGEMIRRWNESGKPLDQFDQVKKRARMAAENGVKAYHDFFGSLTAPQKRALVDTIHEELKLAAEQADALAKEAEGGQAA